MIITWLANFNGNDKFVVKTQQELQQTYVHEDVG